MTSRERLLAVLHHKTPDHVPISPFIQEEYLSYYLGKSNCDRLVDGLACARELGIDFIAKDNKYMVPHFVKKSYHNWEVAINKKIENNYHYVITTIKTPSRELRQIEAAPYNPDSLTGIHVSTMEYLIKDEADFEAFRKYVPKIELSDEKFILGAGDRACRVLKDDGISCPWCTGSVYNLVSAYIDIQHMMVDSICNTEYYHEYMSMFSEIVRDSNMLFAQSSFDAIGIQGNIANGSMMGADYFDEYVLPYEKIAMEPLISAGKPTIYHNCGNARNLYPCYVKLGITCWETVAPFPFGDNILSDAKAYFGNSLALCGTLDQVNFLKQATPRKVYQAASETMNIGKVGANYIFAASDYLERDTPLENVKAMIDGARVSSYY